MSISVNEQNSLSVTGYFSILWLQYTKPMQQIVAKDLVIPEYYLLLCAESVKFKSNNVFLPLANEVTGG